MDSLSNKLKILESSLPSYLVLSESLSSIAPLSSVAAYLTITLAISGSSSALASLMGVGIYGFWVYVGYQLAKLFPSEGGTYTFSRQMYSERIASAVGWVYWGSYMFYMISTSTYASSVLLPLFGVSGLYARLAEIIIPCLIILIMISGIRPPLYYSLVTSMIEIIIIYVLGISVLRETGVSLSSFLPQENFSKLVSGALATSFTVAGGGASFFLGKEARGKGRDVSKSFLIAFVLSSSAIVFSSFYLVKAGELEPQIIGSGFPGLLAARTFEGVSFEEVMFILTFNSMVGSLISAYVALSRLSFSLTGWPLSKSIGLIGALFLLLDSLIAISGDPAQWYIYFFIASLFTLLSAHIALSLGFIKVRRKSNFSYLKLIPGPIAGILIIASLFFLYESLGDLVIIGIVVTCLLGIFGFIHKTQGLRRKGNFVNQGDE